MDFRKLLSENKFVYLDGGMGTMLQASGLELGGIPEMLNFTNPGLIQSVHRQYAEAGSQIVYANTFGANITRWQAQEKPFPKSSEKQ